MHAVAANVKQVFHLFYRTGKTSRLEIQLYVKKLEQFVVLRCRYCHDVVVSFVTSAATPFNLRGVLGAEGALTVFELVVACATDLKSDFAVFVKTRLATAAFPRPAPFLASYVVSLTGASLSIFHRTRLHANRDFFPVKLQVPLWPLQPPATAHRQQQYLIPLATCAIARLYAGCKVVRCLLAAVRATVSFLELLVSANV